MKLSNLILKESRKNLSRLLCITALSTCSIFAYGQQQSVKLSGRNVPLKSVFKQIEKQTKLFIDYKAQDLDDSRVISKLPGATTVDQALRQLLNGTGCEVIYTNGHIIIQKKTNSNITNTSSSILKGTIVDENGLPVIGANVLVKGSKTNGTITDVNGNFSLNAPRGSVLVVSYVGYSDQEVKTNNNGRPISVVMKEDTETLDELVVVGYLSQKKASLTGAVASMKVNEQSKTIPTTSASGILVGKLAGVQVGTNNGIPGSTPGLSVRTNSSWNSQNVMYVIDGAIRGGGDFNNLSPNEIESVTVLKDAASAAVYGSRSAGGVVVVTTKKGDMGKPKFNYSYGYSIDTRTKNADLTSAVQAGELYRRVNGDADPAGWAWSQDELDYFKNVNGGWGYDQLKEVWRNPTTQTHNLSVTGGSDKIKYFGAASYVKQEGFLEPLTYDKFNFRMNVTANITKDLEIFAGLALYNNQQSDVIFEGPESLYRKLLVWQPDQPVYSDNGQFIDYGWLGNVGAWVTGAGGYQTHDMLKPQMVGKVTYKLPFLDGLKASLYYSKTWAHSMQKGFYHGYDMLVMPKSGTNGRIMSTRDEDAIGVKHSAWVSKDYIERSVDWSGDQQLNFQLTYDKIFNEKHHFSGTFVTEWSESNGTGVSGGRETFPVYLTDQFWAASDARADTWGNGSTDWVEGRMSYIGQFNYSYADKYLLNFSFREDGSMKFAPNQRWGFFPAGSAGWVISEENFFDKKFVQFLKLRGSVGLTGNDAVGGWQWQESYKGGSSAFFGTSPAKSVGLTYGSIVNPNLTWEKTLTYDVGIDMNFLNNWNLTFDYWYSNTYDILGNRQLSLPTTFSQSMPAENYGEIHAQGIDFQLGYRGQSRDFTWFGNLTMSYGWNEVIKKDYAENAMDIDIPVGKSTSYITGYEFDRIIRTQEELDAFNKEHPNYNHNGMKPELGMMVYKDLSGPDGTPDGNIDSWDKVVLYSKNRPVVYGLNLGGSWKGLSLDMMFSGELGFVKSYGDLAGGVEWNRMWERWYDDSWTPENPNATLPKRVSNNSPKSYTETSDFWYAKNNYMRLKYLTLSYDLPKNQFYSKIFDNIRIFFTGTNLFVLSSFNKNYYDPEIGDGTSYPIMRSFNFGIDVKF